MRVFSSASRAILHALRVRDAPPAVGRPAPVAEPPLPGLIPSRPRAKRPRPGVIAPLSRVSGSGAERLSPAAPQTGPDAPSPCRPARFRPRAPQFPARPAPLPRREAHIRRSVAPLPRPAQSSPDGNGSMTAPTCNGRPSIRPRTAPMPCHRVRTRHRTAPSVRSQPERRPSHRGAPNQGGMRFQSRGYPTPTIPGYLLQMQRRPARPSGAIVEERAFQPQTAQSIMMRRNAVRSFRGVSLRRLLTLIGLDSFGCRYLSSPVRRTSSTVPPCSIHILRARHKSSRPLI